MPVNADFLKKLPYFVGLNPGELAAISRAVTELSFERGEMVLIEGEQTGYLYFIQSGIVKIFKSSPEGKELTISIIHPGETFNDVPMLDGKPNPISAQALTPVIVYALKKADLESALKTYPQVARNAVTVLASRFRQIVGLVEDLAFRPVIGRVARILLEHSADTEPHRLTQQDMASMAGTAREMVGRSLKSLEDSRAIRLDRHRIVIINKKELAKVAGIAG